MEQQPGWIPSSGGLLVPVDYREHLLKARDAADRKHRGQFFSDYARLMGMMPAPGANEKPLGTPPFRLLRQAARESIIDRCLIDLRIHQIKRIARPCWVPGREIGFRVVHERHADPNFDQTDAVRDRCLEVMDRLDKAINPEVHATMRDFFAIAVEEELTIDRKAMVIFRDRAGKPNKLHLLDGTTIKPCGTILTSYMARNGEDNPVRAAQRLSAESGVDLTNAAWVQEINSRVVAAWTADEMSVDITNPTIELDRVLYGRSILEKSIKLTTAFINCWDYNSENFRYQMPDGFLVLYGDYSPDGLEAFKRHMIADQSAGGHRRVPVLNAGPSNDGFKGEFLKIRESPRDAQFMEWMDMIIRLKCAEYRAHPSSVNVDEQPGEGAVVFTSHETEQVNLAQEEGFGALVDSFCSWLTRVFVKECDPDLILIPDGLDRQPEQARWELRQMQLNVMTLDEVRNLEDLSPVDTNPKSVGDMVLNPTAMQAYQMASQEKAQKEAQAHEKDMAAQQGGPGAQGEQAGQPGELPMPVPTGGMSPQGEGF